MADTKNPSQSQQSGAGPAAAQQQATDFFKSVTDEFARLEQRGIEQSRMAIDEIARLQHAALTAASQMTAEWRRIFAVRG